MVGSRGFVTSTSTIPFLRSDAPSRLSTHSVPSAEILTSLTVRASTFTVAMRSIPSGLVTSQKCASPFAPHVPVTA